MREDIARGRCEGMRATRAPSEVPGALDELSLGVGPVEVGHEVVRLLGVHAELALVQVRDDDAEPAVGVKLERLTLDRLCYPPPFLKNHDGRG